MARIRLILEYEQREKPLNDALIEDCWGPPESPNELLNRPQYLAHELELIKALRANPVVERQLWVYKLITDLDSMELETVHEPTRRLEDAQPASYCLLATLLPQLSPDAQHYFRTQQVLSGRSLVGALAEHIQDPHLLRIVVEDEAGLLASSDQQPSPDRWQREPFDQQDELDDARDDKMQGFESRANELYDVLKWPEGTCREEAVLALGSAKWLEQQLIAFGNQVDDPWRTCARRLVHELRQTCQVARERYQLPG